MTADLQAQISCLKQCYVKMSGLQLPPNRGVCDPKDRALFDFLQAGYNIHDLEQLLVWLKSRIRAGVRRPECLKFWNLFSELERLGDEIALARAEARNVKKTTPKERVLAQARPMIAPAKPTDSALTARPVSELIAELRRAAGMPAKTP